MPTATVNGTVTVNGKAIADNNPLPAGLSLRITPAEGEPMTMALANGQFEFEEVPEGAATFQLYEGQDVAYEFRVSEATKAMTVTAGETANTHAIDIERFASKVICSFDIEGTPENLTGKVHLKKDGETEPAYILDLTKAALTFLTPDKEKAFRGVLPGTYHIEAWTYQGYSFDQVQEDVTVTLEGGDVTLPTYKLIPGITKVEVSNLDLRFHNKYLDSTVLLRNAFAELWKETEVEGGEPQWTLLDTATSEGGYFRLADPAGRLGNEYTVKLKHPDIYDAETKVTITKIPVTNFAFTAEQIRFKPMPFGIVEPAAAWNETASAVALTWGWPERILDQEIDTIKLSRLASMTAEPVPVKMWTPVDMTALPESYNDTEAENGKRYTYVWDIVFKVPEGIVKTVELDADLRFRYNLAYQVNDTTMGGISGQKEGDYLEGTEIRLTATAKEGFVFVAWAEEGKDSVKTAEYKFNISRNMKLTAVFEAAAVEEEFTLTLKANNDAWGSVTGSGTYNGGDEVTIMASPKADYRFVAWVEGNDTLSDKAIFQFTINSDRTITAVFAEKVANESLEAAARWTVYAENGTIVIAGLAGDRYNVYDIAGHLAGQALGNGGEVRLSVAPGKLYIVRRTTAEGLSDTKKIVVR